MTDPDHEYIWPREEGLVDQEQLEEHLSAIRMGILAMSPMFDVWIETTVGYRARLIDAGFDEDIAQEMCVEFHAQLIRMLNKGNTR